MVTRNCFATIKRVNANNPKIFKKRLQLIKCEPDLLMSSLSLDAPQPLATFHYGNRVWFEDELEDITYEDNPKYQADLELAIANDEDWRTRQTHYTRRNKCEP